MAPSTGRGPAPVEIREVALCLVRNAAKEVSGLEVTTAIAAKLGDAVELQIGGAGATIALDGAPSRAAVFPWDVSARRRPVIRRTARSGGGSVPGLRNG